jgi:hypothetical protein
LHTLNSDIRSLDLILRCMPNIQEFCFTLMDDYTDTPFIDIILDRDYWQQMLTSRVPYLKKFDFLMSLVMADNLIDLDWLLDSFRCFVTQYDGWHMAISRWEPFRRDIPCKS